MYINKLRQYKLIVMSYKLFLDDYREPRDCSVYMRSRIGFRYLVYLEEEWTIAKTYDHFTYIITNFGLPDFISFDHDLAEEHYLNDIGTSNPANGSEPTGYHCAKWLITYC